MRVLLVGSGAMAKEYAKVLIALNVNFDVVGRGDAKLEVFETEFPEISTFKGGLENNTTILKDYSHAIIASNITSLAANTILLLQNNISNILVEKPGFATPKEAREVNSYYEKSSSKLYVAYNRRFLASTLRAQRMIEEDGGVLSFNFEFTEWSHIIEKLECPQVEKTFLFLANSTHVVDLAFYLGGEPKEMSSFRSGELPWHKSGAVFAGAGTTINGALFNYNANWISAGRWSVEILTRNLKLIFRPLEKLQLQSKGSVAVNFIEDVDYLMDEKFKPGFYRQIEEFIKQDSLKRLCDFKEQFERLEKVYQKISGY